MKIATNSGAAGSASASVTCAPGAVATDGGGSSSGGQGLKGSIPLTGGSPSTAAQTPDGWRVDFGTVGGADVVSVFAVCAS